MTHSDPWWSKRYQGTVEVELSNDLKIKVDIYKEGGSYWIDKNGPPVHPGNSKSIEGVIHEIGVRRESNVKSWKWV